MYYVYVLYSQKDNKFYIGFTNDIERRIKEHKRGSVHTTGRYKDFSIVYYEAFCCKSDAQKREKYFKTTKGKRSLRLMLSNTLNKK